MLSPFCKIQIVYKIPLYFRPPDFYIKDKKNKKTLNENIANR